VNAPSQSRLFVPLAGAPYDWFASKRKTWELRRQHQQFNPGTVTEGRRIELRRGYRSRESSLWGTVASVVTCDSLAQFFESVDFTKVIPAARDREHAILIASAILGISPGERIPLIGFEIRLDLE
jgi:hypothetical protein